MVLPRRASSHHSLPTSTAPTSGAMLKEGTK